MRFSVDGVLRLKQESRVGQKLGGQNRGGQRLGGSVFYRWVGQLFIGGDIDV